MNFSARPDEEILCQKTLPYEVSPCGRGVSEADREADRQTGMSAFFFLAFLRHYFALNIHDLIGGAIAILPFYMIISYLA